MNKNTYDVFLWIELAAFDNRAPDMGVKSYLAELGFLPEAISLFMWGPDFVHQHEKGNPTGAFPRDIGAYLGWEYEHPKGEIWTRRQLATLIREFQRHGVKVLFSIFTNSCRDFHHPEWITQHPEAAYCTIDDVQGGQAPIINPLKRLADGSFYEDFLLAKVLEVLEDYGFDGWHLADGYNHGWFQLQHGDFSDDMVAQSGIPVAAKCDGDPEAIAARGREIRSRYRKEWIAFHRWRWEEYFTKIIGALHRAGKLAVCNTCWTRDPMESLYRYGIDYTRLGELGIDRMVIETCSAGGELLDVLCRAQYPVAFRHVLTATVLLTKGAAPESRFLFNNCTQDVTEGWSALRHAPPFLEREILHYSTLYIRNGVGKPQRCFDGLQVCLAADTLRHEWQWLHDKWELGFGLPCTDIQDYTLLLPEGWQERELDFYLRTHGNPAAALLYHLLAAGACVRTVAPLAALPTLTGAVLVLNPVLLTAAEREALAAYQNGPVAELGYDDTDHCVRYRIRVREREWRSEYRTTVVPAEEIPEARNFFCALYEPRVSEEFFRDCACAMAEALPPVLRVASFFPGVAGDEGALQVTALCADAGQDKWTFLIQNTIATYAMGCFVPERDFADARILNGFRERPIAREPGPGPLRFSLRIPPHGCGLIALTLKKP